MKILIGLAIGLYSVGIYSTSASASGASCRLFEDNVDKKDQWIVELDLNSEGRYQIFNRRYTGTGGLISSSFAGAYFRLSFSRDECDFNKKGVVCETSTPWRISTAGDMRRGQLPGVYNFTQLVVEYDTGLFAVRADHSEWDHTYVDGWQAKHKRCYPSAEFNYSI